MKILLYLLCQFYLMGTYAQVLQPGLSFSFLENYNTESHYKRIRRRPESRTSHSIWVDCNIKKIEDTSLVVTATLQKAIYETRDREEEGLRQTLRYNSTSNKKQRSIFARRMNKHIGVPFEIVLSKAGVVLNHLALGSNNMRTVDTLETIYRLSVTTANLLAAVRLRIANTVADVLRLAYNNKIPQQNTIVNDSSRYTPVYTDTVSWLTRSLFFGPFKEQKLAISLYNTNEKYLDTIYVQNRTEDSTTLVQKLKNESSSTSLLMGDTLHFVSTMNKEKAITLNRYFLVTRQTMMEESKINIYEKPNNDWYITISSTHKQVNWPADLGRTL
jgi:hypothetical protein